MSSVSTTKFIGAILKYCFIYKIISKYNLYYSILYVLHFTIQLHILLTYEM